MSDPQLQLPEGYSAVSFKLSSKPTAKQKKIETATFGFKDGTQISTSEYGTCTVKGGKVYKDGKEVKAIPVTVGEMLALGQMDVTGKNNKKDGIIDQKDAALIAKQKTDLATRVNKKVPNYGGDYYVNSDSHEYPGVGRSNNGIDVKLDREKQQGEGIVHTSQEVAVNLPGTEKKTPSLWERFKSIF